MQATHTVFDGHRRVASGTLRQVAAAIKGDRPQYDGALLICDNATGRSIDIDLRGTQQEVLARLPVDDPAAETVSAPRARGRPKLGVVTRTVTLLPRHWDWLSAQSGGASVALRKLVDAARRADTADDPRARQAAAFHFMSALAGDFPGFEEATRALFAGNAARFRDLIASWPVDVREHAMDLAFAASTGADASTDGSSANGAARQFSLPADLIPAEQHAAILRLIKRSFGDSTGIDAVTRLPGGASGPASVFRLTLGGTNYLLRLEAPSAALRDPRRHFACLKIAANVGVAPRLIGADENAGISVTEFIGVMPPTEMPRAARLHSIVESLKVLHAAPLFPGLMPYLDVVDILINQVRVSGVLPAAAFEEFLAPYRALASVYPRHDQGLVSSHNDLNPSNVMISGRRAWFVDWESAFAADRFVDIAAVANFFAAGEDDEEIVLRDYFGSALSQQQRARFFLMQQVNRVFYAMVLFNAVADAAPGIRLTERSLHTPRFHEVRGEMSTLATPDGRKRFAAVFLNEAMHHLRSPRFTEALSTLVG